MTEDYNDEEDQDVGQESSQRHSLDEADDVDLSKEEELN